MSTFTDCPEVLQELGGSSCCGALLPAQAGAAETLPPCLEQFLGIWFEAKFVVVLCRDLDHVCYSVCHCNCVEPFGVVKALSRESGF